MPTTRVFGLLQYLYVLCRFMATTEDGLSFLGMGIINAKRVVTNLKNGHPPTWNNGKKAAQTRIQHGIDDPAWKRDIAKRSK